MKIYLNASFECSVTQNSDTVKTVETKVFDGKCKTYIEGMRFVPEGESWARDDGAVFEGEMISPFKDSQQLELMQSLYEELTGGNNNEATI